MIFCTMQYMYIYISAIQSGKNDEVEMYRNWMGGDGVPLEQSIKRHQSTTPLLLYKQIPTFYILWFIRTVTEFKMVSCQPMKRVF